MPTCSAHFVSKEMRSKSRVSFTAKLFLAPVGNFDAAQQTNKYDYMTNTRSYLTVKRASMDAECHCLTGHELVRRPLLHCGTRANVKTFFARTLDINNVPPNA